MKKNLLSTILVGAAFVVGCGGGGGVDTSAELGSLSASDQTSLCNTLLADYPSKSVTCDGSTFNIGIMASQCSGSDALGDIPATCTATVGQAEDCFDAEYNDPCGSDAATATACQPLAAADCESSDSGSD